MKVTQSNPENFTKYHLIAVKQVLASENRNCKYTFGIPTYNRVNNLIQLVNNINNLVFPDGDFNILILDNNKSNMEKTTKLLEEINVKKNITYYYNDENIGQASNWNRVFELSESIYTILIHDDDKLKEEFLTEIDKVIQNKPNIDFLKPRSQNMRVLSRFHNLIYGSPEKVISLDFLFRFYTGTVTATVIRTEAFLISGGFNDYYYPIFDYVFVYQFSKIFNVYMLNKVLYEQGIGENESMNVTVIENTFKKNYEFTNNLLLNYKLPFFLRKIILRHKLSSLIETYKKYYGLKKFDINSLGIKAGFKSLDILLFKSLLLTKNIYKMALARLNI